MSSQIPRVYAMSFATNASVTNGIDVGGGFLYITIEVPGSIATMFGVASTPFYLQVSSDNVTYRRYMEPLTSTVSNDFSIASSVSNRAIGVPYVGNRYLRIEASATVTGAVAPPTFKIVCTDSL